MRLVACWDKGLPSLLIYGGGSRSQNEVGEVHLKRRLFSPLGDFDMKHT